MNDYFVRISENKNEVVIKGDKNFVVNGKNYYAEIFELEENIFLLGLNGKKYRIVVNEINNGDKDLIINGYYLKTNTKSAIEEKADQLLSSVHKTSGKVTVKAPMPGMIVKLLKNENSEIDSGDSVLILEAMKMENDIKSPKKGKILKFNIKEGEAVEKGSVLFEIE